MRNSYDDRHNFDKEMYGRLNQNKPPTRQQDRNPIIEEDQQVPRQYYQEFEPTPSTKKKNRMLARGDFSDKNQGTFAFSYDNYEDYRPSKKCFNKYEEDPIKPPDYIPPANFKRPDRNPITQGDYLREPELRLRPDQISNVFNTLPPEPYTDKRGIYYDKNKSSVFDQYIPEPRTVKSQNYSETSNIIHYKYAPNYRDNEITAKPSNTRYEKEDLKQYDDLKSFTDVMKEKRNTSNIFFS
ncbi:hypothetical protein SteCoe_25795 [Stentor coeruleus]|uniref:Uncharacterized protein n=1 Tax=Stentor coeruleus TaxID=5963 RepID=A0A1R2BED4_9CILI|nr:hypothetical protein SteCoe_25795 [Stentor coeruleus]